MKKEFLRFNTKNSKIKQSEFKAVKLLMQQKKSEANY